MTDIIPRYSPREELANAATHGIGILLSISAIVILIIESAQNGTVYHIVSSSVFGASLLLLYTMSTMYHLVRRAKIKKVFRALDHSSIFLLIAGTYTPFTLVTLSGGWGWSLFGVVWGFALVGILTELFIGDRFKKLSLSLYICMGWLIIIAIFPLVQEMPSGGLLLLVSGGVCYTVGTIFYVWKSLYCGHAIWHLFVLGGSSFHFLAIFLYVIP
ncbi:MAG: hemolysin III family protein [Desulfocapsaceae bacterium]|nr:hemolysin III family protein [Desulfocapsaceae bacterium]